MDIWFNIPLELDRVIKSAATTDSLFDESFNPDIRPAEARHGDFQVNGVLPWAKKASINPRHAAQKLMEAVDQSGELDLSLIQHSIAGPGFINFRLSAEFLLKWLLKFRDEKDLKGAAGEIYRGKRIAVDFSSPNAVKQMHVGHIRSIVIGEVISRLMNFCGAEVIRDNHIGDWGTHYGVIIMAIKRSGYQLKSSHDDPLEDFERLYREGTALLENDSKARDESREELVKLQNGDRENMALWEEIRNVSLQALQEIYDLLNIRFDEVLGESFYRDKIANVYEELSESGIAELSEGALVVFHKEHPRFNKQPFIIRKSDGASLYSTTDLATVCYRINQFHSDEIDYVVDARQSDHFEQLFLTAEKWLHYKGIAVPKFRHVSFGTILGENGKAIRTRSGEQIKLKDFLYEAIERAYKIVSEKNPDLSEEERKNVARVVGLGAVRYADLMQNRTSDYLFSWDKLLSFDGNTAPYLLYAVARIYSIFRKVELQPGTAEDGASLFTTDTEISLARKLVGFVAVVNQTISDLRPHFLCAYLYELAVTFSTFYKADKVIVDNPDVRARRLLLCARTLRVLETGLHLLGLDTLKRM